MTSSSEPAAARSRGRSAIRLVAGILLALLAFAAGVGIGLHTPWGMKAAANLALRLAHPRGMELSVAGAHGGFLLGLELYGVRLRREDGSLAADADTLIVRYRLNELIGRSKRVREVAVAGVHVAAAWSKEREPDAAKPQRRPGQADFTLDRIAVRRGSALLHVRPVGRDSVLEIEGLGLSASALRVTRGVSVALDTLTALLRAPAAPAATLRLAGAGRLLPGRLSLAALTLDGERTRVSGAGTLALPTAEGWHFENTDFRLRFAPLAGGDIRRFLPALGDPGDLALDFAVRGADSTLHVTLAAGAERGGHVNLEAHLPARGGAVALRTDGSIRDLDLGAIAGGSLEGVVVTARWNADVEGPVAARISGPLSLDLAGTRAGTTRLEAARIAGRFDDGRATIRIVGAGAGFVLEVAAWATPLSTQIAYDLSGSLAVPPLSLAEARPVLVAGDVPFRIQGRGFRPDSASATVSLELRPDASVSPLLGPGRLAAGLDSSIVRWELAAEIASGSARAEGDIHLAPVPRFRVRRAEVDSVNVAALAGDTTASRLDARFHAEGHGTRPDSMSATAVISSLAYVHGVHEIRDARADLRLEGGRARLEATALVDSAAVKAQATIASLTRPREARMEVAFSDLDPARWAGGKAMRGRLAGRLNANIAGPDLAALFATPRTRARPTMVDRTRGAFRLALEPSSLGNEEIRVFELTGDLAHGAMRIGGMLESSFGAARLAGEARPFDAAPSIRLDRVVLESLDPTALLARAGASAGARAGTGASAGTRAGASATAGAPATAGATFGLALSGTIAARASGADAGSLEGEATLDLGGSRIHRLTLDRLAGHARLERGRLDARLDLGAGDDSAALVLDAEPFADPVRLHARGALRFQRLGEILASDTLRAAAALSFDVDGALPRGRTPRDLSLRARIEGNGSAGGARLDSLIVHCDVERGVARLERLALRGNMIAADGRGRIALPGGGAADSTSLRLEGSLGELEPLAPLLGLDDLSALRGRFTVTAVGPARAVAIRGDASLKRPHVNQIWADSVAVVFSGQVRESTLAGLSARITARSLVPWPLAARDVDATFEWDGRELGAVVRSLITEDRSQELALRLEPRDGGVRGRLERFVHRRPGGTVTLEAPVSFEAGKRLFLGDLVLLDDGVPLLRARGGVEETGAVGFHFELDSLDLADVQEFTGLDALTGSMSLDGSLTGTRERPVADASLRARVVSGSKKPAAVDGRLEWADGVCDVRIAFDQARDNRAALTARLPLALTLAPAAGASRVTLAEDSLVARIEAERFDLSWFEPLISPHVARGLKGWLDGVVDLTGDPQRPALSGRLALSNGRVGLPSLGVELEKGEAALGFAGRTITLERARLQSGGDFEAAGAATLYGRGRYGMELDARLRRFVPVNTAQAKAELNGALHVSGSHRAPRVRGEVTVQKTTIYAEKGEAANVESVELSARDRLDLRERFGVGVAQSERQTAAGDSLDLDVNVKIGDNVWVRRRSDPIVALELQGDVRARKLPGTPLDARGTLGVRTGRSYLSFMGRRFEMLGATVGLPGPVDSASVHLEAFYSPNANESNSAEVDVTARVDIDADGLVTDFSSEPYLDRTSLLNYLATGQVQGNVSSNTAYGLAVGSALGAVGGAAGRSLGLDVVTVTMDSYGGQTLGAGSYVNPRLYLGFRQPVVEGKTSGNASTSGSTTTEFEIEVEARRNLLLNLQGSTTQYRFILRPRLGR